MRFNNNVPFDHLYQSSLKEASRKKPVFFIHKYFARRITANFRMALLDYLINDDNVLNEFYSSSAGKGKDITVLDPFMGGGTTILESLRFGCNVIGNDLQPLSYFVTRGLIEPLYEKKVREQMIEFEKKVGQRIKNYYKTKCPCCGEIADTMYAFHVKIAKCKCGKKERLFSSFVIAYKKNEFTIICPKCGKLHKTKFNNGNFICECGWTLTSPKNSYIKKGIFECPDCNEKTTISEYADNGDYPFSTEIIAIEYYCPHCDSHDYKYPDEDDLVLYQSACIEYENIKSTLPIPQQKIPIGYNTNQIINHGYVFFKDLFNYRQLLTLGILLDEINKISDINIQFWFQLAFSGMLEMNNMFCRYQQNAYKICNIFFNHAYVPITMPVENCVWGAKLGTGTFVKTMNKIIRGKHFNYEMYDLSTKKINDEKYESIKIFNNDVIESTPVNSFNDLDSKHPLLTYGDSRKLDNIPEKSVDLILTDPPYGANVMYSELIDFFHCWNHMSSRAIEFGFRNPLSPKAEEVIVNNIARKNFEYYQSGLTEVLKECYKKTKDEGYLVFSFHDKSIDSWLSILKSIYNSGFKLIKTYPVQAEARTGAHTSGKNSIGIDMMLICKKQNEDVNEDYTLDDISLIKKNTLIELGQYVERLNTVGAKLTMPDVKNILLPLFIKNCHNKDVLSEKNIRSTIHTIENMYIELESKIDDFNIIEKRSGWWSELFADKWRV